MTFGGDGFTGNSMSFTRREAEVLVADSLRNLTSKSPIGTLVPRQFRTITLYRQSEKTIETVLEVNAQLQSMLEARGIESFGEHESFATIQAPNVDFTIVSLYPVQSPELFMAKYVAFNVEVFLALRELEAPLPSSFTGGWVLSKTSRVS